MAVRYVLKDSYTSEYLANKIFRGYYLTPDISQALRFRSSVDAEERKNMQTIRSAKAFTVEAVNFS